MNSFPITDASGVLTQILNMTATDGLATLFRKSCRFRLIAKIPRRRFAGAIRLATRGRKSPWGSYSSGDAKADIVAADGWAGAKRVSVCRSLKFSAVRKGASSS